MADRRRSQGRYVMLYSVLVYIALALFSGFGYRVGGSSWFSDSVDATLPLRVPKLLIRASGVGVATLLIAPWPIALAIWLGTALLDSFPYSEWQGCETWSSAVMMGLVQITILLPFAFTQAVYGPRWHLVAQPVIAFAAGASGYFIRHIPSNFEIGPISFKKGTEVNEFFRGALRIL